MKSVIKCGVDPTLNQSALRSGVSHHALKSCSWWTATAAPSHEVVVAHDCVTSAQVGFKQD